MMRLKLFTIGTVKIDNNTWCLIIIDNESDKLVHFKPCNDDYFSSTLAVFTNNTFSVDVKRLECLMQKYNIEGKCGEVIGDTKFHIANLGNTMFDLHNKRILIDKAMKSVKKNYAVRAMNAKFGDKVDIGFEPDNDLDPVAREIAEIGVFGY